MVATFLCGVDIARGARGEQHAVPRTLAGSGHGGEVYVELPSPAPEQSAPDTSGAALPDGARYAVRGAGTFTVVPGSSPVAGRGPLQRYTVEVESGVSVDAAAFAEQVQEILGDPRGWGAGGRMAFQRVDDPAKAAFRISLTSAMTVRTLCGYDVKVETSCYNGAVHRVIINDARWVRGALAFRGDIDLYRQYLITHEVGHRLGHDHQLCASPGAPAPVMMQQTLSVGRCVANPWPYPDGVHEVTGPPAPENLPVATASSGN